MKINYQDEGKKKILIISPWESTWSLGEGAGVSDDHYFIQKALKCGFAVHFLAPGSERKNFDSGREFYSYSYPNFFRTTRILPRLLKRIFWPLLFQLIALPRAVFLARRIKPDFILGHSHYTPLTAFLSGKLAGAAHGVKLFGVMDLVHMEWNRVKYFYKNFEQILSLKIPQDVWIILDDGTRGKEAAVKLGIEEDKISFLPNGINTEWAEVVYGRNECRSKTGIPLDACAVLFLARFVPSKRPDFLVKAIPRVLAQSSEKVLFIFAGDGSARAGCEALAGSLGVSNAVRFLGVVPHARVPEIMSSCDIFVSTSSLTNMAMPTCEAFACGLPVVAFEVGDTAKVVCHGETGLLVKDGDVEALADAISKLVDDKEEKLSMGKKAREFAKTSFTSWDKRTDVEMELISSLLKN